MVLEPLGALAVLARTLGIDQPDLDRARDAVESWEPLPEDPKHRFDGRPDRWREQLSLELRRAIENRHADWLVSLGYNVDVLD